MAREKNIICWTCQKHPWDRCIFQSDMTNKNGFQPLGLGDFWDVDPETEIIYVFLSNRTFPDENNNSLSEFNIRTEIQKLVHEAFD